MNIKNLTRILTILLFVTVLTATSQLITGCRPTSGDYGVFDLRSDNPDPLAATVLRASLTGKVVDSSNKSQAGVVVRLFTQAKIKLNEMNTTSDGSFLFNEVVPGSYLLEAASGSAQYDVATYTVLVNSDGSVLPKIISLVVNPVGFAAEMLVDVHGKVTDLLGVAAGTPAADADVKMYKIVADVRNPVAPVALGKTQAMGLFLFRSTRPGLTKLRSAKAQESIFIGC